MQLAQIVSTEVMRMYKLTELKLEASVRRKDWQSASKHKIELEILHELLENINLAIHNSK